MGHTVPAMRYIIQDKINHLKKLAKALREPERSAAISLIYHIHQHISAITYANPFPNEVEEDLVFVMLVREKMKGVELDELTVKWFVEIIEQSLGSKKLDKN